MKLSDSRKAQEIIFKKFSLGDFDVGGWCLDFKEYNPRIGLSSPIPAWHF